MNAEIELWHDKTEKKMKKNDTCASDASSDFDSSSDDSRKRDKKEKLRHVRQNNGLGDNDDDDDYDNNGALVCKYWMWKWRNLVNPGPLDNVRPVLYSLSAHSLLSDLCPLFSAHSLFSVLCSLGAL